MRAIFLILIGLSSLSFAEFTKQNGVISDSSTKLEWQDDYNDNGGDIKKTTWQSAIDYCEALSLDGGGWRLPNIRELESIVDDSKNTPAMDSTFELTSSHTYWSATTNANYRSTVWIIYFNYGVVHYSDSKDDNGYVRCVRDIN